MWRVILAVILGPTLALLGWLALRSEPERADFVLTAPEPRTLDPHRVSWLWEIELASALFEGLTRLNAETFQPEPAVAAAWDVDATGTVWTFHLRPQARWSDGRPVLAEDFRFAWLRALDAKVAAQYAGLLFVLRGGAEFYRSRMNDDPDDDAAAETVGIEVDGPHTLRVTLRGPCPYFLDLTSFPTFAPLPRATVERWAYRDGRVLAGTQQRWTRPGNLVGNGPFVLTRWDFKRQLRLERNPHYWDAAGAHVASLEVYITSDPNAALLAYETGRVDLIRGVEGPAARLLLAQRQAGRRPDFHVGDRLATFFFRVNCTRPPLDDADFRKALSLAIDREAICRHVTGMGEQPADTYVPRQAVEWMPRPAADGGTVHYRPPAGLGATLTHAQRAALAREHLRHYLDRAGLAGGGTLRTIELAFPPEPELRRIAEVVQQMWQRELGLRIELKTQEAKVLSSRIRDLDYDLARSDWFGDYLDPDTFLNMFRTGDGQNRTGWSHAQYDRLLAGAAVEADNRRRFALLEDAERILCEEELPIIPLFFRRGNFLLNPRFEGLRDNIRGVLPLHRVRPAGQGTFPRSRRRGFRGGAVGSE